MFVLINDKIEKRENAKVDIEDRGYQFGDGVYEVIKVYNGKLFTLKEHMDRLERSVFEMKMRLPFSREEIEGKLKELLRINHVEEGAVYLQITRGGSPRQHHFPDSTVLPMLTAYPFECHRPKKLQQEGVEVTLTEDIRWKRCDIKSLNLLGNVLAKQEAKEAGKFEAVMHRDGGISEGSSTNFYGVLDGNIFTHPVNNLILNGITRIKVVELCRNEGIPLTEKALKMEDLEKLDEAFITSTTSEVLPVIKVGDTVIGEGVPGAVTRKLQKLFNQLIDQN
ncbi:D-amino-acid transaminase [Metabacillus sp. RGM 3146]|uniref:D-amino-acid transaminase n=1 Tax=Metabacillus sp. RGM 3146 TaxID=3401092 RepID=UPI003B995FB6